MQVKCRIAFGIWIIRLRGRGRWGKTAQRGKTDHQPSRLNRCWYLLLYALTMFVFLRNNGHLELMLLGCIAFELLRKMLFFVKPI